MSGCVRKVLGHFNIVIIIIIEIKQHSSSRHKELPALLLLRAWPKLFSVSRLYILCSTFSQLVGCFTALFFFVFWWVGVFGFSFLFLRHFVCYFLAQKVCCPAFTFISGFWPICRVTRTAVTTCVGVSHPFGGNFRSVVVGYGCRLSFMAYTFA